MKHQGKSKIPSPSAQRVRTGSVRLVKVLTTIVVVSAAFVVGFTVRGDKPLLESLGFSSYSVDVDENPGATTSGDTYDSIGARVAEVEGILKNDSLDSYDLDEATTNVLDALADTTQDNYLRYYDAARYASLVTEPSVDYAGIGVLFSEYNGRAYAVDVFDGSVAQAAGVRRNDFIVAIDGDREHDWTLSEVTTALAREKGESVVVTWRRPTSLEAEGGDEYTTTLVCSEYRKQNVEGELVGTVGYITLRQLTQNSSVLVKQAVNDLASQGATSYVLDVRDNPGGYLTQAVDIASLFVKSGTIVRIQTTGGMESTKTATGSVATDKPLVVVTNGNTAAAAEVLASALKENQRATIVGTATLGKGSVQVVRALSFGGALRYTAAYYKSPLGHDINIVGVTPDVAIGLSEGAVDNQRTLAIETSQSLVRS